MVSHLVDHARKLEWQLVSEIDGGADVLANVQTLAYRNLEWNCSLNAALSDFHIVDEHRHGRGFAALSGCTFVVEVNHQVHLASQKFVLAEDYLDLCLAPCLLRQL